VILALLLTAADPAPKDAIEAERAFAADAQKLGQWTAFRKYAGSSAVMFVPKAVNAQEWLRDRKDPPRSVRWQAAQSFQSCDGLTAINVGPWQGAGGSFGYFTTVWIYEDGLKAGPKWQWVYDGGDALKKPMRAPAKPSVRTAACKRIPGDTDPSRWAIPSVPSPDTPQAQAAKLHSRDKSLRYDYQVDAAGNRKFTAWLWNGRMFEKILEQTVTAPPK
jgi:hypothetical protein